MNRNIRALPKIELHCHLDGSLRIDTILDILKSDNKIDATDIEEIRSMDKREALEKIKSKVVVPIDTNSLVQYLDSFELPVEIMQTEEVLERVAFELLEDAAKENVKYIEVRYAPLLHTRRGLGVKEIISSVLAGMKRAEEEYGIKGNLILGCMRNMSEDDAIKVIEQGKEFIGRGVVAVDLCGPEEEGFCKNYLNAMSLARSLGYHVTIHAGEAASGQNVLDAINLLGATRIGHGVRTKDCKEAYDLVKSKGISLEMCPTSNIQTKAVSSLENHPFCEYLSEGIRVSLNTDNRTVSDIDLSHEIKIMDLDSYETYEKIYKYSVESSFADEDTKSWLLKILKS
ncbi:MAG: adenosine deaminase [Clostridioides sp.]|jgi:adenosine deaminase|nr:adenosine deaminase [Clostridioides sp.]